MSIDELYAGDDMICISDQLVKFLYKCLQQAYYTSNELDKLVIKDVLNYIGLYKPTFEILCSRDVETTNKWYKILMKSTVNSEIYSIVMDELEDILLIDYSSSSSSDVSP